MDKLKYDIEIWATPIEKLERGCVSMVCRALGQISQDPACYLQNIPKFAYHGACDDLAEDWDLATRSLTSIAVQSWVPDELVERFSELYRQFSVDYKTDKDMWNPELLKVHSKWGYYREESKKLLRWIDEWVEAVGIKIDHHDPFNQQFDYTIDDHPRREALPNCSSRYFAT